MSEHPWKDARQAPIVTLTMNPALDVSTAVDDLVPSVKLRCGPERLDPGGGGLNAARLIARLCGDVLAVYTTGGGTGEQIQRLLEEDGVPQRVIQVEGETRQSLAVAERRSGLQYRFVLPGPTLTAEEGHAALDAVLREIGEGSLVLASGSLPPGVPADFYARLAKEVEAVGARLILDTSGEPLRLALEAGVYLAKPNWREFDALAGVSRARHDAARLVQTEQLVRDGGAEVVIVTLGDQGALLVTAEGSVTIESPHVEVDSPVGGGDCFAGGLMLGLARGSSLEAACRLGVASAAAAVGTEGTAAPLRRDIDRIQHMIAREPIGGEEHPSRPAAQLD